MKIAVIDDEKYSREELIHQIHQSRLDVDIQEASSGAQAVQLLEREPFDLLFVDIHLGDMMGTTIASLARKLSPYVQIVFATAYPEYGVKAFELGVDNYILKPFDPERVAQVMAQCAETIERSGPALPTTEARVSKIAVTVNRHTILLDTEHIVYIETSGADRHCILHTVDKSTYSTTVSLGTYESQLLPCGFFRVHKTCLVQLKLIRDIFPWSNGGFGLHMQGFTVVLPIGRERVKRLRERLGF
jgi:Response regulator of the LytR/AlgR family